MPSLGIHEIRDFTSAMHIYIYIFTLMRFVVKNQQLFQTNSAIHSVNISNKDHLHTPSANLSCFQKNCCYDGTDIFNSLPLNLKSPVNTNAQFKVRLKLYLNTHSFYSVEEIATFKNDSYCL